MFPINIHFAGLGIRVQEVIKKSRTRKKDVSVVE